MIAATASTRESTRLAREPGQFHVFRSTQEEPEDEDEEEDDDDESLDDEEIARREREPHKDDAKFESVPACVKINQCVGCTRQWNRKVIRALAVRHLRPERGQTGNATPSSRLRVDGVEEDSDVMIQHERAVKAISTQVPAVWKDRSRRRRVGGIARVRAAVGHRGPALDQGQH